MKKYFNKRILCAVPALVLSFGLFGATASASEIKGTTELQTENIPISECRVDLSKYNADNFGNGEKVLSQTVTENDGEIVVDTLFELPDSGLSVCAASSTSERKKVGNKKSFGYKTINGFEETAFAAIITEFEYNSDADTVEAINSYVKSGCPSTQRIDFDPNPITEKLSGGTIFSKKKLTVTLKFKYTNNLNKTSSHSVSVYCKSDGSTDGKPENEL